MADQKTPVERFEASDERATTQKQITEILLKAYASPHPWLMITEQHEFSLEGAAHPDRDSLVDDIASCLTCHVDIVAIYQARIRIPDTEIAQLKEEALKTLGPISRAKALGYMS